MKCLKYVFLICLIFPSFIYSQFHEKVVWQTFHWKVIHSTHFDLHYPEHYDFLGKKAVEIAEAGNLLISKKLAHNLSEVIPIYIYPSHAHFQMSNIIPGGIDEGIGGLTESVRKRIIVPYAGSYAELRHTLSHEIVHAFQYDIILSSGAGDYVGIQSQPSTPLWLIEGMAEYYSIGWDSQADMMIRDAVLTDTMPSIMDMNDMRVISPVMLYKGGQILLQYLALTYGEKKIAELLRDSRDQRNIEDAIKTNFGVTMLELNKNWMVWLKRLYYPEVEKKSLGETARKKTSHLFDKSMINLYPAISPDGKTMAYITVRHYSPVIVVREIDKTKDSNKYAIRRNDSHPEKIVVTAGQSEKFFQLHLIDNNISFTPDSKNIFFSARSRGKDVLYLFDYKRKKILKSWAPDADMIQYPSLSHNAQKAVFAASVKGKTDLYVLDLKSGKTDQLTSDYYSEKDPVFSPDDKTVYYSSNIPADEKTAKTENIENTDYDLFSINLDTLQRKRLLQLPGVQQKPQVLADGKILFISDHSGGINAFCWSPDSGKVEALTDSFEGVLSIKPDQKGDSFLLSIYQEQGFDIAYLKKDHFLKGEPKAVSNKDIFIKPLFPSQSYFLDHLKTGSYRPKFALDTIFFGLEYSTYYSFGGFAFFSISEYMGDHQFTGMVNFIQGVENMNFNLDYFLLKYRTKLNAGIFKASGYFSLFNLLDLTSLNNLIYDQNRFTESLQRYGGYIRAEYPWTSYFSSTLGVEIFRYEEKFWNFVKPYRLNINTNVFSFSAGLGFNNALYSYTGPIKGSYLKIYDKQSMNITGSDYVYNMLAADFRHYFNFFERYVFAIRAVAGAVLGPQKNYFPWNIGGPFTIRGYDFLSLQGVYTFMLNMELRFPLVDYIIFGFPVQWIIRGFTAVAFFDIGSAFNDFTTWRAYDPATGRLDDLKFSFGLGLRVILIPGILLRFDWATPWDLKTSLPMDQWKFYFSLGYEY